MEEIFCKQVPLTFKSSERDERKSFVKMQMGMQANKHESRKELVLKLTDEQDLFFLYTLHLAEEDFQSLKTQQGLLVDFSAFPQKLIDLLEMCIKEENTGNPKFILNFVSSGNYLIGSETSCTLNVIETNPFKHLNHLSLKFMPASDVDVKTHLADCLKQLKECNSLIQHKFEHTTRDLSSQLKQTQEILSDKSTELESLKLEWSSRLTNVSSKHKEDLTLEKEKTVQFQSSLQLQFEKERREMEQAHAKTLRQLETRANDLETANKELTDKKYKSEVSIQEYKSKLSAMGEEFSRVKSELYSLRKENSSLDSVRHEQDKSLNQLQTRVAVLEQELKDKGQVLEKSNDLLEADQDKKKHLEIEIEKRQREVTGLEGKTKAMSDELKKGNEIIKKLQNEIKSYHAKVKLRTQIATEQEKLLGEKDQELEKLRQDLATTKDTLRDTQDQNTKLSSNLENATQKLEESKKLLKTNESMIQWLNKQINETRISHNHLGTFEMPSNQSRPPLTAIHNFSASSHGSILAHEDPRFVPVGQRVVPSSAMPSARQSQVHYQPGHATPANQNFTSGQMAGRKSAIPVAHGQSVLQGSGQSPHSQSGHSNPSPIPEERLNSSGGGGGGEKVRNPVIDPKFLMKRDEAIPVRGLLNAPQKSSTSIPSTSPRFLPSSSAPSQAHPSLVPPASTSSSSSASHGALQVNSTRLSQQMIVPKSVPPLASAYFPSNS